MIGHGWQIVDGAGDRRVHPTTFVPRELESPWRAGAPADQADQAARRRLDSLRAARRVERAIAALRAVRARTDRPVRRGASA
jgi:hypothetical protein